MVFPYSFGNAVHSQLNDLRSPPELCRIYDFLKNPVVLEFISQLEIVILSKYFFFKDNVSNTIMPILNKSGYGTRGYINNSL